MKRQHNSSLQSLNTQEAVTINGGWVYGMTPHHKTPTYLYADGTPIWAVLGALGAGYDVESVSTGDVTQAPPLGSLGGFGRGG